MKKQKTPAPRRFPWLFLSLLCAFCIWLTYLYGVFYIPSLPRAEVPPFLQNPPADTQVTDMQQTAESPAQEHPPATAPQQTNPITDAVLTTSDGTPAVTTSPVQTEAPAEAVLYRRRDGVHNILCVGRDAAAYNTDVLMLVSFDTKNGAASVVQIPRDTYLDGGKINALWAKKRNAAKKNGSSSVDDDAMELLCKTLEQTLCIQIDHWILCNLAAFRDAVDALGGVTVTVPCDMDYEDPAQNLSIHLSAGEQLLNGAQAEGLVRFRSGYVRGDLGRVDAQKLFLTALLQKVKEVSVLQLPALLKTAAVNLSTSLSPSDLLYFAKSAQKVDLSRVSFLTLPGTDCREYGTSGAWYYVLSRQGVWEVVNNHLNVYQTAVDGKLFDRDYRLTNTARSSMLTYYQTYLTAAVSSASGIAENGVSIALNTN
ncbi:MAG: LCP family protein [Clostridia bacterium]|nr:LCP family protein [Clostridia bacterium]